MKINLPVTQVERKFDDKSAIISTTDLKGLITGANNNFLSISGFSKDELMGKNHNVVRHPDMPPAAFADLWATLHRGESWMGIVKNRCKNGDHYWVDAFAMPISENGRVSGYESVRVRPRPDCVGRAEALYKALRENKSPGFSLGNLRFRYRLAFSFGIALSPLLILAATAGASVPVFLASAASIVCAAVSVWLIARPMDTLTQASKRYLDNAVACQVYAGRGDEFGQIEVGLLSLEARLRTVIVRIEDVVGQLIDVAAQTSKSAQTTNLEVGEQRDKIAMVTAALNEMTTTVQSIAFSAAEAAEAAERAAQETSRGSDVVQRSVRNIEKMANEVDHASSVIQRVEQGSQNITLVVNVIRGIAEQTNLLALNAAIEAARAGEQGRGFAVVADEVRKLANHTQTSTQQIQDIVLKLQVDAREAAAVMTQGSQQAKVSVEQAEIAAAALAKINQDIDTIKDMNLQVASAVEQQSAVSVDIVRNIGRIGEASDRVIQEAQATSEISESAVVLAGGFKDLVSRFSKL